MEEGEIDFKEVAYIFKKNWWMLILLFLVIFSGVTYYTLTTTPEFESSALVMISAQESSPVLGTNLGRTDIDTQIAIIQSDEILNAGIIATGENVDISIQAMGKSNVIEVKATANNPFNAQKAANAVVMAYMDYIVESKQASAGLVSTFIDEQLIRYDKETSSLNKAIFDLNQKENLTNEETLQLQLLTKELDAKEKLSQQLLSKREEVRIIARENSANIQIIQKAQLPNMPSSPNIMLNLAVGLIMAIFGAIGLVYIKEMLRGTVTTIDEIEQITGSSIIGDLPRVKAKGEYLVQHKNRNGKFAEKIRMLRTNILFNLQEKNEKILLVTSASKNDGKTMSAVNLAVAIAHSKQKVLLIDANIREPKLHEIFRVRPRTKGLTDIILLNAKISEGIKKSALGKLDIIFSGAKNDYPGEIFTSEEMKDLLTTVSKKYDIIIIDAPTTEYAETSVLARLVKTVLFVVKHDRTTKTALETATKDFVKKLEGISTTILRNFTK